MMVGQGWHAPSAVVDILRPSLLSGIVTSIRLAMAPVRRIFYQHWTMIK